MKDALRIDVIIPVYNSQAFLPGMLRSLEMQTFRDFRVVFVDDGSTDGTYEWLQTELQTVNFAYLLLHQENQGPSAARNYGLNAAQADWICFCDSDDTLSHEYLEYLYQSVTETKAEMGYCQQQTIAVDTPFPERKPLRYTARTAAEAMAHHYANWIAPVCLVLNRAWLQSHSLTFDEACRYCEDLIFITDALAAATTVVEIPHPLYHYFIRSTSLLRTNGTEKYEQGMQAFSRLEARMADTPNEAAAIFLQRGKARFVLAILRRAALQLPTYAAFHAFAVELAYRRYAKQEKFLPKKWQLAARMYRCSDRVFYYVVRKLFRD